MDYSQVHGQTAPIQDSHTQPEPNLNIPMRTGLYNNPEPLKSVLMWGISHSVTQLGSGNTLKTVTQEDFHSFYKVNVDSHNFRIPGIQPASYQFKEYCPVVFSDLRSRFESSSSAYLSSWTDLPCSWDPGSRGHSDSRFLRSHDGRYYAKTIASSEVARVLKILPAYRDHVMSAEARHCATYLPKFMAVYRIQVNGCSEHLLVMRSVIEPSLPLSRKYDLKGCQVARRATHPQTTLKDVDFLTCRERISVGPRAKAEILSRLKDDVTFLLSTGVMDYSLLVGVHDDTAAARPDPNVGVIATLVAGCSDPQRCLWYSLGLIDILTVYGLQKRAANACKAVRYPQSGGVVNTFSSVPPRQYADRFLAFIEECFV